MKPLIKLLYILPLCAVAGLCALSPIVAHADPQRIVIKKSQHIITECDNIIADIMIVKLRDLAPTITVVITNSTPGRNSKTPRFDVAKNQLTSDHSLDSMRVGCLTRNGGAGIEIPHPASDIPDLKIQIDANGQVFIGYDKVGLELVSAQTR